MFRAKAAVAFVVALRHGRSLLSAQVRLADESDRAAFRAWFVLLADAQFERQTEDVKDCAALVRHAVREALRAHTPEWVRRSGLPFTPQFADVRSAPRAGSDGLPLFRDYRRCDSEVRGVRRREDADQSECEFARPRPRAPRGPAICCTFISPDSASPIT